MATAMTKQPTLAQLTARFLAIPSANDLTNSVEPHETPASFTTDPRTAWNDALAVAKFLGLNTSVSMPTDWSTYTRVAPHQDFLPLAIGNFPQQVRDLTSLITRNNAAETAQSHSGWSVKAQNPNLLETLLNAASQRTTGEFDRANQTLTQAAKLAKSQHEQTLVENEKAVLAWANGDRESAKAIWKKLPQNAVVVFNLGLLAKWEGDNQTAHQNFRLAIESLPDDSGWYALALLYLALE